MKISEQWLREWVDLPSEREVLADLLTMSGLEVESVTPLANFTKVVIGQIIEVAKHPDAERLVICKVDIGKSKPLTIVCGAPNARVGIKIPTALVDAKLANGVQVKSAVIRNIASDGMLCSEKELGLSEEQAGLLELSTDAPVGEDLVKFLNLHDYIFDVGITPNRGDCLSIQGLARETSALLQTALKPRDIPQVTPSLIEKFPVNVSAPESCPRYVGRIIRNINIHATTPDWMLSRLKSSGVRVISPIVDITNYVMLELGQPMHAFDLDTLKGSIEVRNAKVGEQILLLDDSEHELDAETLIIADQETPLAIAGVMGGLNSSVTADTQNIFLESAYFKPTVVARQRQFYHLSSESAYRFERGVDWALQRQAIERASELILSIAGGEPGEITEEVNTEYLPQAQVIKITKPKITSVLGVEVPDDEIEKIFDRLNFQQKNELLSTLKSEWQIAVPSYRFDISLAEDVIEEIARLYGYDKIPTRILKGNLNSLAYDPGVDWNIIRNQLSARAYHEIITYSFIDKTKQNLFNPQHQPQELINPISADMTVMRTSLLPGLVNTLIYNQSRQQERVRLFEIGACFIIDSQQALLQLPKLGMLMTGAALPEQWGNPTRLADFFDLKGDVEYLLHSFYPAEELVFKPEAEIMLHPGQSASIYFDERKIGFLGALHPHIQQKLELPQTVFVMELELNLLKKPSFDQFQHISKFPEIRRDIAIIVNEAIPAKAISDTIKMIAGDWLKDVFIFDVYQGKGISPGFRSIALALILQHPTRTLVDDEATKLTERVITALKGQLGAELRS